MASGPADSEPDWDGEEPCGDEIACGPPQRAVLARLEKGEPLTPGDEAVLARLGEDLCGPEDNDDGTCPPEEYAGWQADLAAAVREAGAGMPGAAGGGPGAASMQGAAGGAGGAGGPAREVLDAGFTHRGSSGGTGFAGGGVLDRLSAGWLLAMAADRAWECGLAGLSDDELAGLACAQRRLASRAAAGELAVITELAARRAAPDGVPGEHLEDEVAAMLTLTGRAAARRVALAAGVARLPAVAAALAAGRIDADKAGVFAAELAVVEDDLAAAAIAAAVAPIAPARTTGELGAELRWQVAAFDPQAAARRKEKAHRDARVDVWIDPDGTGAISGRGLDPAAAIAADQGLDADARWLQEHGAAGTLDQLRVAVLAARLSGQPLRSLLPRPARDGTAQGSAGARPGNGSGLAGVPPGPPDGTPVPAEGWTGGLGGSVNLTMPVATWLGRSDMPGDAGHYGTLDAATCRDLSGALAAAGSRARWCITLVDQAGWAVGHGCARAGPGPPGSDAAAWLAAVTISPIETGTCAHRRESAGYRPSSALRHIVKIRSPRCGYPGCRRRAARCDDDHSVPWHKGGRTCECNLHPLCRRHHRAKQASGWLLTQPEPGILTWTLPSGRTITTGPEPYPV